MLLVFDVFSVWEAGILKTQAEFKITPEDAL